MTKQVLTLTTSEMLYRHWSAKYGGIPWTAFGDAGAQGVSCWALIARVYEQELNVHLPKYGLEVDKIERAYLQVMLYNSVDPCMWQEISSGDEKPFDLVTFTLHGCDAHVGIVTQRNYMLHVTEGILSCVERYDVDPWITVGARFWRIRSPHETWLGKAFKQPSNLPRVITDLGGINTIWYADRLKSDRNFCMPTGTSLLQALYIVFPGATDDLLATVRITIDLDVVPPHLWHSIKPRGAWNRVVIRIVPRASSIFKIILSLALTVGAAAISGGLLGPAGLGLAGAWLGAGTWGASLLAAGVGIGGNILLNALIPTRTAGNGGKFPEIPSYTIGGYQNKLNADGPVPTVLGKIRFAPPFAAMPYNQNIGPDRYNIALFLVGYGPVRLHAEDIYIGNTPISNYQGVELEVREGWPDDEPITLYPSQVIEDADNMIDMPFTAGYQSRVTAKNVTRAECEFFFARGLVGYQSNISNNTYPVIVAVNISIQYRKLGETTWVDAFPGGFLVQAVYPNPMYSVAPIEFPERGQYEIRCWRTTADLDETLSYIYSGASFVSKFSWSALRSFRPEAPTNYTRPMAMIAVRIKASGQLSGNLAALNVLAHRIAADWDPTTQTWLTRETSNPASLERYVHQGPENAFPKTDDMLDLEDFQSWAEYCITNGLEYNAVHDQNESQDDVLEAVAMAGRALHHDRGDKRSIIVDRPRVQFNAFITPANSSNFTISNPKISKPHAFEIDFLDQSNLYQPTSRIVPWYDHEGDITLIQKISLPGKTNPAEIWREARRKQYEADLRQNAYTVTQSLDALTAVRGDAAVVSHRVMKKSQAGGYIIALLEDGMSARIDNYVEMEQNLNYQCRLRHTDGTTSVRALATIPGKSSIIRFADSGDAAELDDLVMIGEVGLAEYELIIKDISYGDDFDAELKMVAHASTLDALAAAESPPVWDGIIGGDGIAYDLPPDTPILGVIRSGLEATGSSTPMVVFVPVYQAGLGGPVAGFEVYHKLNADSTWLGPVTIDVTDSGASISGVYVKNNVINVKARAFGPGLTPLYSPYTAVVNHTVAQNDP
jgi:hypothetical protein